MTQPDSPADRWIRFDGPDTLAVIGVGEWMPGEVKCVPGRLAEQLLIRPDFAEADEPASDEAGVEDAPAKASRRRVPPTPEPAVDADDTGSTS